MVEVEIIRPIWHEGRPTKAGAVVSLDAPTAAYVVGIRRAVYVVERVEVDQAGATSKPVATDDKPEAKPRKRIAKGAA